MSSVMSNIDKLFEEVNGKNVAKNADLVAKNADLIAKNARELNVPDFSHSENLIRQFNNLNDIIFELNQLQKLASAIQVRRVEDFTNVRELNVPDFSHSENLIHQLNKFNDMIFEMNQQQKLSSAIQARGQGFESEI